MPSLKPVIPVSSLTIEIVREIQVCSEALGVELLLVGAQAKVILLEHIYGLNPGRATQDIDIAFAVESWEQFETIKQNLINRNFRALPTKAQKLLYQSQQIGHEYSVDIIPFGVVQDADNNIAWPPDLDIVMSVSGYQEALQSALLVEIEDGLIIKVVSLPGLAILKLIAWSERGSRTENRDAIDFLTLLRNYHDAGNTERIYEIVPAPISETLDYNPEQMAAWLLGYDAAAILDSHIIDSITQLLETKEDAFVLHMAKSLTGVGDALETTQRFLNSFKLGFAKPQG